MGGEGKSRIFGPYEIRFDSVLKLNRAAHRASNYDTHEEVPR
jgi:hypothetical protein